VVKAIVGYGPHQIGFRVFDFSLIDGKPARESFLNNVFGIGLAA
jgi:hypothetical protein